MSNRLHDALDGELDPTELSPEERERMVALGDVTNDVVESLRRIPVPDLTVRIMEALPPVPAHAGWSFVDVLASATSWIWRPRSFEISLRPAYAAVAIAFVLLALPALRTTEPAAVGFLAEEQSANSTVYVQFRLDRPSARSVALAGSFTGWAPRVELVETSPGVWSALVPLEPGVHDYTFVIDEEFWITDPAAPMVTDGFGGVNSRLFLTRPLDDA